MNMFNILMMKFDDRVDLNTVDFKTLHTSATLLTADSAVNKFHFRKENVIYAAISSYPHFSEKTS